MNKHKGNEIINRWIDEHWPGIKLVLLCCCLLLLTVPVEEHIVLLLQPTAVKYIITQYSKVHCIVQHLRQYSTVQYSLVQYSTSTVQYST